MRRLGEGCTDRGQVLLAALNGGVRCSRQFGMRGAGGKLAFAVRPLPRFDVLQSDIADFDFHLRAIKMNLYNFCEILQMTCHQP
jgi:hypothetical protein